MLDSPEGRALYQSMRRVAEWEEQVDYYACIARRANARLDRSQVTLKELREEFLKLHRAYILKPKA